MIICPLANVCKKTLATFTYSQYLKLLLYIPGNIEHLFHGYIFFIHLMCDNLPFLCQLHKVINDNSNKHFFIGWGILKGNK